MFTSQAMPCELFRVQAGNMGSWNWKTQGLDAPFWRWIKENLPPSLPAVSQGGSRAVCSLQGHSYWTWRLKGSWDRAETCATPRGRQWDMGKRCKDQDSFVTLFSILWTLSRKYQCRDWTGWAQHRMRRGEGFQGHLKFSSELTHKKCITYRVPWIFWYMGNIQIRLSTPLLHSKYTFKTV